MSFKGHEWGISIWEVMIVDYVNVKPTHFIGKLTKVMNIFIQDKFICNQPTVLENGGKGEV
jgi:hypothetical protein